MQRSWNILHASFLKLILCTDHFIYTNKWTSRDLLSFPSKLPILCSWFTKLICSQVVLDSHRWVPLPAVGFSAHSVGDENQEDVTPPSNLMEHPPLAVFINGESSKCFPIDMKRKLLTHYPFPLFHTCPRMYTLTHIQHLHIWNKYKMEIFLVDGSCFKSLLKWNMNRFC